jgi:hypothetical protein
MKIHPVEPSFFMRTVKQTPDIMKKLSAFRNFANAPKLGISQHLTYPLILESALSEGHFGVKI